MNPTPWLALALLGSAPAEAGDRPRPTPEGFVATEVMAVVPLPNGAMVMLVEIERQRFLQIMVGGSEGLTIALRQQGEVFQRPLTHDLLDALLTRTRGRIVEVRVDEVVDETFTAEVVLRVGRKEHVIDARASDSIAIALGRGLPVFVAEAVLEEAGTSLDALTLPGGGPTL